VRTADLRRWTGLDNILTEVQQNGFLSNKEYSCQLTNGVIGTMLLSAVLINWEGEECVRFYQ